ncbi:MAG: hypothetical protein AB9919_07725 [Geobacteraceae bacterium]
MKKLIMTLGMFLATVAFSGMAAQAKTLAVNKVIAVPGATSAQVLEKVKTWAGMYGRYYNIDAKTGVVVASGEISYPSPSIDRIQYTILFEMKNKIQGNKDTVTFEKVMLKSPVSYISSDGNEEIASQTVPVKAKKDVAAATKVLNHIADNLEAYLLAKSDAACPLEKCPDCQLLTPSSEEMKEHMKTHEHMKGHPEHETAPMK